jgi:hypothetical protein
MCKLQRIATILSLLLTLTPLTMPQSAHAAVKIIGVEGASNVLLPGQNTNPSGTPLPSAGTGTVKIYGGTAGVFAGLGTNSGTAPFNTCLYATPTIPLLACNNQAIDSSVFLKITYISDKAGYPVLIGSGTGTAGTVTPQSYPTTPVGAGATGSVIYRWGEICTKMNTGTSGGFTVNNDCSIVPDKIAANQTFTLGISAIGATATTADADSGTTIEIWLNNDIGQNDTGQLLDGSSTVGACEDAGASGLCAFSIGNGDSKVVLRNLVPGLNFPTGGPLPAFAVRLLWTPGRNTFDQITASSSYQDLKLDQTSGASPSVSPSRVTGFNNDEFYSFKAAVVDMANNVGYYTAPTANEYCIHSGGVPGCHVGHPGEVVGILSKDLTCFVATAAYGSQMAPQVEIFRQFRDRFLYDSSMGIKFVRSYYKYGPKFARMIARSEFLRAVARVALLPALAFAWMSVKFGIGVAIMTSFLALMSLALLAFAAVTFIRDRRRTREARWQSAI